MTPDLPHRAVMSDSTPAVEKSSLHHPTEAEPPTALTRALRRLGSPACLLLALLLFPLPWVEIRCSATKPTVGPGAAGQGVPVIYTVLPHWDSVTQFSQTGWQAAQGTCTINRDADIGTRPEEAAAEERKAIAAMQWSALMTAYPLVVFAGALAGLVLPIGRGRRWVVAACSAAALALVLAQVKVGFPLEHAMYTIYAKELSEIAAKGNKADTVIHIQYTPWFLMAVLALFVVLGLTGLEWWLLRRARETAAARSELVGPEGEPQPLQRSP
jgi:hypothetical protein